MSMIIEKAVDLLNDKFNLPKKGFLAGGALANTINKLVFGGKCIINDIDIFIIDNISGIDTKMPIFMYFEKYTTLLQDTRYEKNEYDGIGIIQRFFGDNYITVKTSKRLGIFNYIKYDSNKKDYQMLLKTFDINCTEVGYDLENRKAYWSDNFENYCNTKELKITGINNPTRSVMRILKKRDELDALLNIKEEFNFLLYSNLQSIKGLKRFWVGEKYFKLYKKYENEILPYFNIIHRDKTNKYDDSYTCWRLYPKNWNFNLPSKHKYPFLHEFNSSSPPTKDDFIKSTISMDEYEYFWRNIKNDSIKVSIWKKLQELYKHNDYLIGFPLNDVEKYQHLIDYLSDMIHNYPCLIISLNKMTLIKQLKVIKWIMDIFDQSLSVILTLHTGSFNFNTIEELNSEFLILKIYYRKEIYDNKNNRLENHFN